jgi:parallel beta-helix repeat protein
LQKLPQFVANICLLSAIGLAQTTGKVSVTSPISGSTVVSPVHFVASAQAPANHYITAMRIYVDYQSVYYVKASKLDTYVTMAPGSHKVTVQAWDNSGTVYKQWLSLTVATMVGVTISPTSATVQAGQSKQFTTSVTGTTNTSIIWQVAGITGGNSTVGLISSTGLYTAPLSVPATNPVTVTARSYYDTGASASASVTVTSSTTSNGTDYYVSTTGSDSNDGSAAQPWKTIQHAATMVTAGYTVHVAPGTYYGPISTSPSGTSSARIRYISDSLWGARIYYPGSPSAQSIWYNSGSYVDIVGFEITGLPPARIGVQNDGSNVRIMANKIHDIVADCTYGGEAVDHSNYYSVSNDTVGNMFYNIKVASTCTAVHGYGIYHAMKGGKILNNIIFNNGAYGIHLWHAATDVIISENTVFNNGEAGILIGAGDSPGGVVENNTVVANNILYKNGIGLREYCAPNVTCIGSNNQYLNNLIYANGTNTMFLFGHTDSGRVSADPEFVSYTGYSSGDYHLMSTSPAIDKGTSLDAPSNDFVGGLRPYGSSWDIGAYEWGSTPAVWPWQ